MGKILWFTPGCDWKIDRRRILFVEYETVTGELTSKRFDLSAETEYIVDWYKTLSFDEISKPDSKLQYSIKKIVYFEKECNSMVAFTRGCRQTRLFIPTKVYFEAKAKKTAEEIHNKLLRNIVNSAYGIVSRGWIDGLADSAGYIYMSGARRSGKTMWLSNIAKSIEENARYDAIERWLNEKPIKPIYFDTDMVMTREEMQYCLNDVKVTEKIFKEEQIMRFNSCKPTIKNIIFNDPATIVMWSDGTKTVVKCGESDTFDPEKGVAMCCMKKLLGTNKTGSNYLDKVQEYFDSYIEETINNVFIGEILSSVFGSKKKPSNSKDIPPEVTVEKEFEAVTSNDWTVVPADENTIAEENGE